MSVIELTAETNDVFSKHLGVFANPKGAHLLERTEPLGEWLDRRAELNTWPYARTLQQRPASETVLTSQNARRVAGMNFGSQDYLGLAGHPDVIRAAKDAIDRYGLHAAASPMLQGNTVPGRALENALGEVLQTQHVILFPTGWAAGFGTITGLVRPHDSIVIDQLAHSCLMSGARAATQNVYLFRHNDVDALRNRLSKLRAKDAENAILVVSEGLFSMDSDSPCIEAMQKVCREFDAVLMMDIAHDFGASGPGGTGQIGMQKMIGKVDIVMGSFSKTFATNGGFMATNSRSARQFLGIYGGAHIFSNGISPVQTATALEALRIVRSDEGAALRARSFDNILRLRAGFESRGIECLGDPSNVVPVMCGDEVVAKITSKLLEENGLIANLVEYPAVPRERARFRFQVMASHSDAQIDRAVEVFARCMAEARD